MALLSNSHLKHFCTNLLLLWFMLSEQEDFFLFIILRSHMIKHKLEMYSTDVSKSKKQTNNKKSKTLKSVWVFSATSNSESSPEMDPKMKKYITSICVSISKTVLNSLPFPLLIPVHESSFSIWCHKEVMLLFWKVKLHELVNY